MTRTTGTFETPNASRYLQQLCKHFGHKVEASFDESAGTIAFPARPLPAGPGRHGRSIGS